MDWTGYSGSLQHGQSENCALSQIRPDETPLETPFDEDLEHHRRKRIRLDDQFQNPVIQISPSPKDFYSTANVDSLATSAQPVVSSNNTSEPYLHESALPSTIGLEPQASYVPDSLTVPHSASEQGCEKTSC